MKDRGFENFEGGAFLAVHEVQARVPNVEKGRRRTHPRGGEGRNREGIGEH